jgi:hypothetical protein
MDDLAFLSELKSEIKAVLPLFRESSELLIEEDFSRFPVFTMSKQQLPFGTPLLEEEFTGRSFRLGVSTAEEFIELGIIPVDKAKNFIASFKPADKFACLFVVPEQTSGARFVFYPYDAE